MLLTFSPSMERLARRPALNPDLNQRAKNFRLSRGDFAASVVQKPLHVLVVEQV